MPKMMYQCEYCGLLHSTKAFAEKCEKSHTVVKKVLNHKYDPLDKGVYPTEIKCEMSDGKTIIFYSHGRI